MKAACKNGQPSCGLPFLFFPFVINSVPLARGRQSDAGVIIVPAWPTGVPVCARSGIGIQLEARGEGTVCSDVPVYAPRSPPGTPGSSQYRDQFGPYG